MPLLSSSASAQPRRNSGALAAALVAVLVVLGACSSPPPPTPVTAGDVVEALSEAGQSEDVASCVVGLLGDRIAGADLVAGAELSAADQLVLDETTTNCELASDLLAAEPPPADLAFDITPQIYGDDSVLDRLWDACANGVGEACDNLWAEAPIGSAYERFGVTCGERFEILDCGLEMDSAADVDSAVDAEDDDEVGRR